MSEATSSLKEKYPILIWRGIFDIASCWIVIGISIWAVLSISWWLYPLAAILIANRVLALSLLCHEGLHGTLFKNRFLNDFLARYLCAFPTGVSFTKYRRLHLLHHSTIGSAKWDPDRHLYAPYPLSPIRFIARNLWRLLTLQTLYEFLLYYTDLPELLRPFKDRGRGVVQSLNSLTKGDFVSFLGFHTVSVLVFIELGVLGEYLILFILPVLMITQPYVLLMGGLQHGPIVVGRQGGPSRSVAGSKLYMWLLLPLDINYHAEHHYNASVPHYWLKEFSKQLQSQNIRLWHESYVQSLRALFMR